MFRTAFPLFALLSLSAPAAAKAPRSAPSTGQSALYACADGRAIEVLYSGGDVAVLTIGGSVVEMSRAGSANGERYVGGGWQWWGVGVREGSLSLAAAGGEPAAQGITCRVR